MFILYYLLQWLSYPTRVWLHSQEKPMLTYSYLTVIRYSEMFHRSLKLAVSRSDHSIEVYQLGGASLSRVCGLSGHGKPIGDVVFAPKDDQLLYSCSQDGAVKLWDLREKGTCAQEYQSEYLVVAKLMSTLIL